MCGINGIALSSQSGRSVNTDLLERMRDCLVHRGRTTAASSSPRGSDWPSSLELVDVAADITDANENGTLHIVYNVRDL